MRSKTGLKPGNSKYLQFLDNFDKVVKPVCMDFDFVSFTEDTVSHYRGA